MLERLTRLLRGDVEAEAIATDRHQVAAAALLVTAGGMDDDFDAAERTAVIRLLRARFDLDEEAVAQLLTEAETAAAESVDFFGFTHAIKQGFPPEERVEIIEMLWEVVYADGVVHDHEASLMRRVAGLLGVEDRDSGAARARVRARLAG